MPFELYIVIKATYTLPKLLFTAACKHTMNLLVHPQHAKMALIWKKADNIKLRELFKTKRNSLKEVALYVDFLNSLKRDAFNYFGIHIILHLFHHTSFTFR